MSQQPGRRRLIGLTGMLAAGLVAGCASAPPKGGQAGASSPGQSLGLIGPTTPDLLAAVRKAPYATPTSSGCAAIWADVAALDEVLGPDVDAPAAPERRVSSLVTSTVVGFVPYRGVIRFVGGASRKERARAQAVLAGMARRGYLRGLAQAGSCARPPGA